MLLLQQDLDPLLMLLPLRFLLLVVVVFLPPSARSLTGLPAAILHSCHAKAIRGALIPLLLLLQPPQVLPPASL
jgi:hypothetical protein